MSNRDDRTILLHSPWPSSVVSGGDPYVREQGPGNIPPLTRLRMDLGGYGAGKTKDECGTGADARAIADRCVSL